MAPGTLPTALLALVVLTAGCIGAASPASQTDPGAPGDSAGPTIAVTATGTTEVAPDEAVVRVAVVATGADPSSIRDALASGAADLRTALADAGVEDVTTSHYSIGPDYRTREEEPTTYRGVHAFTVTVAPDDVGAVVDAAAGTDATVQGVHFTLSEAARREARATALAEAMGDARNQADVVATEGDLTLGQVRSATTGDLRYVPYETRADAAGGGAVPSTTVEPGPVTVSATVHVTYDAS